MGTSSAVVVTVLDTTKAAASDTGATQTMKTGFLKRNVLSRLSISLGSGDSVVIEGKSEASDSFVVLYTWTAANEVPINIYLPLIWRARRSVDGGGADSKVKMENYHQELLNVDV